MNIQHDDISCNTMLNLISEKKLPSLEINFANNERLLHKFVREGDKSFNALVASQALNETFLYQVHDALAHKHTARTYQCVKWLYYWRNVWKDHVK